MSKFLGKINLLEGILAVEGIWPIGAGLHDPFGFCKPLVRLDPAQKLMKLFFDVSDATCPAVGVA